MWNKIDVWDLIEWLDIILLVQWVDPKENRKRYV